MGRSVDYLSNATKVWYCNPTPMEFHEDWEDFMDNLIESLTYAFPSLHEPSRDRWDGRETKIILENANVEFGLSEYCGLVSLSVRPREDMDTWTPALAERWINQVTHKITEVIKAYNGLKRVGGFSNGESIYQKL